MSNLPGYILRNCTIFVDRVSKLGQVAEITLPVPQVKVEEIRNAGMVKPREVNLGYEKTEASFKMPGMDPQIVKLFGLSPGKETMLMATGALVDETGVVHSAVATMWGFMKQADPGGWKPGDVGESDLQFAIHSYKLEVDGQPLIEADDFDVKIGGVSQTGGISAALLV